MQDQIALQDTGKRELALERSQRVSRALHDAARKARQTVRGSTVWQPGFSRAQRGSRHFALVTALTVCILPTMVVAAYLGLMASDVYRVEAKFALKNREILGVDMLGSVTGFQALQQVQDSMVAVDYVQSRAIVEKIDAELNLRSIYARSDIDYFSRFDASKPVEDLVRYWKKHVRIDMKLTSGILELDVRAFRPEDALKVARAVVAATEHLVNDMSNRSRRDALAKAQEEVKRAEERLSGVRELTRTTRNQEGLIDPRKSSDEVLKLLGEMKLERIKLENEIQVGARSLSPTAPQSQNLRARLEAMSGQIATLERTMTTLSDAGRDGTLSQSYAAFEKAKLDQDWAEKYYQVVAGSLEKARIDTERQQVYLEAFVKPVLPEEAEYPRRLWLISLMALGSAGVWVALNYIRSIMKS